MAGKHRGVSRRSFLKTTATGAAAIALGARSPRTFAIGSPQKQPNILLIMSDEHNPIVTGCYGNRTIRTPHMDSIAEKGVTFDTHYCNSPLCVPSRASFTSGKYCSRVSVWNNSCELPTADIPSLPRVMNAAGYESFLCGKQHYESTRRYGFTEVGGNFNNNFKNGHGGRRQPDDLTQKRLSPRFDEFHPGENGGVLGHDRRVTAGAVDFLQKRQAGKPFFLFTGYLAPHFPLIVPEEYWKHYQSKISMPNIPPGHLDRLPLNYKHLRAGFQLIGVPDDVVKRGRELYHGLTEWVDNEIGKVLAALRNNPAVAENTVIIYTSDHGEHMGEHGLWWKNAMYEHASRVPLAISWPQRWKPAQRRAGASSHVDLVKTVAEIGGAHTPDDWNGDSLAPWLDDATKPWKDFAVSEYYAHNIASGYAMARSAQWKYTYHTVMDKDHPAQHELYDLTSDPGEFTNLADKPEHKQQVEEMHRRLTKEVGADPDETEQRARKELAKGYDRSDTPAAGKKRKKGKKAAAEE